MLDWFALMGCEIRKTLAKITSGGVARADLDD
jgi:hypothetical protein